ncbi:hypothetical protein OU426_11955 [Frigidibacter sp. RF13]|uniref:hypothetical protein n=1 Tax=Frigidibacter sp. RF13 TaxID=2997340 RepID=UPI002270EA2F|nr:hypothetical protein [Frigidibacter sp. RF13]MCY1127571.1 hypothetical protein [Frigidibacter sp. RF13]
MTGTFGTARWLKAHWFAGAAALVILGDWVFAQSEDWRASAYGEPAILADLILLLPLLHFLCYRPAGRALALRGLALACAGVWIAGHLVPRPAQQLLHWLEPLRWVAVAALMAGELALVIVLIRAVIGGADAASEVEARARRDGLPEWAIRALVWEARLWQRLFAWRRR